VSPLEAGKIGLMQRLKKQVSPAVQVFDLIDYYIDSEMEEKKMGVDDDKC
jgi:hypothetical protein